MAALGSFPPLPFLQVLFVPSARLEFRITEFSWRDIPYFMYKRSEATAHGTRDYLIKKWGANFPNTGFWTYIKYTIVEQHVYRSDGVEAVGGERCLMPKLWKDQAALVFGFFQMVGYNRYTVGGKEFDFLSILSKLDGGWSPRSSVQTRRQLERPVITKTRPRYVKHLDELLPYGKAKRVEVGIEHEYLPFSIAKLTTASCEPLMDETGCGLVIEEKSGCVCWMNMPTFKSNSLFIRAIGRLAALIKIPSRVTTFVEMTMSSSRNGTEHVLPLRHLEGKSFSLATCNTHEEDCSSFFSFSKQSSLKVFRGAPNTVVDTADLVRRLGSRQLLKEEM